MPLYLLYQLKKQTFTRHYVCNANCKGKALFKKILKLSWQLFFDGKVLHCVRYVTQITGPWFDACQNGHCYVLSLSETMFKYLSAILLVLCLGQHCDSTIKTMEYLNANSVYTCVT